MRRATKVGETERGDRGRVGQERDLRIGGFAKKGFGAVRDAFIENFGRRDELGAACCIRTATHARGGKAAKCPKRDRYRPGGRWRAPASAVASRRRYEQ